MAGVGAVGREVHEHGPAPAVVPFFALIPLRPTVVLWPLYQRAVFLFVRLFPRRFFSKVQRLGTVHAMRWMLVPAFAPHSRAGRAVDRHQHLLFESNYSGDGVAYIESFCITLKPGMARVFKSTLGYPGVEDPKAFTNFALSFNRDPEVYYAANPGADPVQVQQALLCYRRGAQPADMVHAAYPEPEFVPGAAIAVRWRSQALSPRWTAVIVPVRADRVAELREHLQNNAGASACGYPFHNLSRVHFARLTMIDDPSATYLVFTATFDAVRRYRTGTGPIPRRFGRVRPAEVALGEIIGENFAALDTIFQYCEGYTSAELPDARGLHRSMLGYMLAHQRDGASGRVLPYCAYPEATVSEIRRALAWMTPTVASDEVAT